MKHRDLLGCLPPPFCAITRIFQTLRELGIGASLCSGGAEHTQLPAHVGSKPQFGRRGRSPSKAEGRELVKGWEKSLFLFPGYLSLRGESGNPVCDVGFARQITSGDTCCSWMLQCNDLQRPGRDNSHTELLQIILQPSFSEGTSPSCHAQGSTCSLHGDSKRVKQGASYS